MKTIAGVLFLILLFPLSSSALPIIQDTGDDTLTFGSSFNAIVGQSFSLTDRTDVASVGVFILPANPIPGLSFEMSLFEGEGFGGTELISNRVIDLPSEDFEGYADMDVSSVSFVTGIYTLALFDVTEKWAVHYNSTENPYDGGTAYVLSSPLQNADLRFRVKPIPEPATILLLGAGLVGLAGLGRKKFRKK